MVTLRIVPTGPYEATWKRMRRRRPWAWVGFVPTLIGLGRVVTTDKDFRRMSAGITLLVLSLPIFIFAPGSAPTRRLAYCRRNSIDQAMRTRTARPPLDAGANRNCFAALSADSSS